jgi:hypothetical protein
MTFDDLDPKSVLRFGKYKGKTVEYVMKHNLNYIMWAMEQAPNLLKTKPVIKKTNNNTVAATDTESEPVERAHVTMDRIRQQMMRDGTFEF